ncbi:MAG: GNAT family N-acetyltransferase [bacterium]
MSNNQENTVRKNTDDRRFELMIEGKLSMIGYDMPDENNIIFTHTEVPEELEGRALPHVWQKLLWNLPKARGWR